MGEGYRINKEAGDSEKQAKSYSERMEFHAIRKNSKWL